MIVQSPALADSAPTPSGAGEEESSMTSVGGDEGGEGGEDQPVDEDGGGSGEEEAATIAAMFPVDDLQRLDEMLNRTRWIVPVLPKSELECLLDAAIRLCRARVDTRSEPCQRFFRDGLNLSFVRVMNDDAVNTWKYDIYVRRPFC